MGLRADEVQERPHPWTLSPLMARQVASPGREGWMVTAGGWRIWIAGSLALETVRGPRLHCPVLLCPGDTGHGLTTVVARAVDRGGATERVGRLVGMWVATAGNHPKEQQEVFKRDESSFWSPLDQKNPF